MAAATTLRSDERLYCEEISRRSFSDGLRYPDTDERLEYAIVDVLDSHESHFQFLEEAKTAARRMHQEGMEKPALEYVPLQTALVLQRKKAFDKIRQHEDYNSVGYTEKEHIKEVLQAFFDRRYTSFVWIASASNSVAAANASLSTSLLRLPINENIIENNTGLELLMLPDESPNFNHVVTLLREKNLIPRNGEPDRNSVNELLLELNRERWRDLLRAGINRDPASIIA